MRPRALIGLLASLCACVALTVSCGLEEIPYLEPPIGGGVSASAFTFFCTPANAQPEFLGFELYYKFYTTEQTPSEGIADRGGLLAAGFRRVSGEPPQEYRDNINKPLIDAIPPVAPNLIEFNLDFAAIPLPLRRAAYYSPSNPNNHADEFKSFRWEYDTTEPYLETDPDVGTAIWGVINAGTPSSNVRLALYVLSYGLQEFATDLYSDPVYLGYIDINFGW